MSSHTTFNRGFSYMQQSTLDEPYFAAGSHPSQQLPNDFFTTNQIEEDIDASLQQFPGGFSPNVDQSNDTVQALEGPIDLNGIEMDFDYTPWMASIAGPSSMPPAGPAFTTFSNQDDFVPGPPKRIDSGLRATAKEFVPSRQHWQNLQAMQLTPNPSYQGNEFMSQSRGKNRMSHMTPLRTNLGQNYLTPPLSAPSRPDAYAMQQHAQAISPMISLTDESCFTSPPQAGYQWASTTPPAFDINTWAQGTRDFVDPARLTPITPVTPTYGGSSLVRTSSKTSRGSRTTAGATYVCEHENCGKQFKSKNDFHHHKRNHGDRRHSCDKCPASFVFRKDLGRHQRVHTKQREMYGPTVDGCEWCSKGFGRKDHYDRHMRGHVQRGEIILPTPAGSSAAMSRTHSRQ